jgi:hypothetical protein
MWLKWLPWRYVVSRVARASGFIDPVAVVMRLHRFAQPGEVEAPLELMRAGMVFHARGLMNSGAIQQNLDWLWPYWVERQFDPADDAFIPRAFSLTLINLTHRNWTAVGLPDCDALPLVDPRGLVTPFWDSWSLDAWFLGHDGRRLYPTRAGSVQQGVDLRNGVAVVTQSRLNDLQLASRVDVAPMDDGPVCRQVLSAYSEAGGWLVVALRPYNPEGVSFIHEIELAEDGAGWNVAGQLVQFDASVDRHRFSHYRAGDVHTELPRPGEERGVRCEVGLATAAAMFEVPPGGSRQITVRVPLLSSTAHQHPLALRVRGTGRRPRVAGTCTDWSEALVGHCTLRVPDERFAHLYDVALRTLVLLSPEDVYPGPYTYKRFWFRDAAFLLHALLCAGLASRAVRAIRRFPLRQARSGYFRSQEGEWDSNGAALWIMQRYCQLTGWDPEPAWGPAIRCGGQWIVRKRLPDTLAAPHAGLLPAGFSAEHLGPNDYYYWDDFWGVAGLHAAAEMLERLGERRVASEFRDQADRFTSAIERSLAATTSPSRQGGVPASPYRRMDAGAIGSLAASYPLQLWAATEPRLLATAEFLLEHCFVDGGFFQDMIHSGINAYLTLHVAQVLLRAGDARAIELMHTVASLASPTGQWPEAIHPRTRGGCMGDGQHAWAAAEWVLMLRNCFVREEASGLVLASGIPPVWLDQPEALALGPAPTPYGDVDVTIRPGPEVVEVAWQGHWRGAVPSVTVALPGYSPVSAEASATCVILRRADRPDPSSAVRCLDHPALVPDARTHRPAPV